jgi:hypothetical protein
MGHRMGLDHQAGDADGSNGRVQPTGRGQLAQLAAQFAALVADQPRSQPCGRLGTWAAIEHDLAAASA